MEDPLAPTLGATLVLGFILGLKHATEADHVVAVSAIVIENKSLWKSAWIGAFWGLGHTLALLLAGIVLLYTQSRIPDAWAAGLELGVAAMIIALGLGVLRRLLRERTIHVHVHEHDGVRHVHLHAHVRGHEHVDGHRHRHALSAWGVRASLVGIVHGLAGSAALTLLVMQEVSSVASGIAYIAVFGGGTMVGMLLMSGLISVPIAATARGGGRLVAWQRGIRGMAGLGSVAFGLCYGYAALARAGLAGV